MGGFLTLDYCLRKIGCCFPIVFWIEENKVTRWRDSPIPPTMEIPVHFTCILEKVCQTSVVMSHKCNCIAFVTDVQFSITDSRSLTLQKELIT